MNLFFKFFIVVVILHCECETLGNCLLSLSRFRKKQIDSSEFSPNVVGGSSPAADLDFDQRLKRLEKMLLNDNNSTFAHVAAQHAIIGRNVHPSAAVVVELEKRIELLEKRVESFQTQITAWFTTFELKQKHAMEQQIYQLLDQFFANQQNSPRSVMVNRNSIVPMPATTTKMVVDQQQKVAGKMPIYDTTPAHQREGRRMTVSELIAYDRAHSGKNLLDELRDQSSAAHAQGAANNEIPPTQPSAAEIREQLESQRSGPSNLAEQMDDMDKLWIVSSDEDKH